MLNIRINDGETEVDVAQGFHVWFRHAGVESLLVGDELQAGDRERLRVLRDRIWALTEELVDCLLALSLKDGPL